MSTQPLEGGLYAHKAQGGTPAAEREHFLLGSSQVPCHGEGEGGQGLRGGRGFGRIQEGEQGLDTMTDEIMQAGGPGKTGELCSEKYHRTDLA